MSRFNQPKTWAMVSLLTPGLAFAYGTPSPQDTSKSSSTPIEKNQKSESTPKAEKSDRTDTKTIQQRVARIEAELQAISKQLSEKANDQTEASRMKLNARIDTLAAELEAALKELGKTSSERAESTRRRMGDYLKELGERISAPPSSSESKSPAPSN